MLTALLTGSSGGIGRAAALSLLSKKYRVIGISRTSAGIEDENFIELLMDLHDTEALERAVVRISRQYPVDILINNAGVGFYGLHSSLTPAIINVSSITAKHSQNTHGAAYGATKAGLSSFGASLFAEVRKHGVSVINIHPDMTDTGLYRNADFGADTSAEGCFLSTKTVADAITGAIEAPGGVNICDITVSPQYHRIMRKKRQDND